MCVMPRNILVFLPLNNPFLFLCFIQMLIKGVSAIIYFMKITKFTACLLFLAVLFLAPSCKDGYDDSELTGRVENLENRVQKLEEQMNSNINSLQTILEALDNNDYITKVVPITNGEKEIGYTIHFSKGNSINIYHGQDGVDGESGQGGYTPQIGVKQDIDGIYYWTLDGEWMTDENGNKIKAQGIDGHDGTPGQDGKPGEDGQDGTPGQDGKPGEDGQDGITPKFKIESDYWWVSYDNGTNWTQLGKATGGNAKNMFQSVTVKESEVEFILSDGTTFVIPQKANIEISYSIENGEIGISEGHTVYIDYRLSNANEKAVVTASSDGNFITKVIPEDVNGGKISIISANGATEGYINVMVSDGNGYTFINVINIFENRIEFSEDLEYHLNSNGGDIIIPFSINTSYMTKIVDDASWVSINPQSRANMHNETLNISVKPNTSNSERIAKIQLYNPSNEEDIFAEISIIQSGYNMDDQDKQAMILTADVFSRYNYTVHLPQIIGSNITIDWGDGTQENYETTGYFTHQYSVEQSTEYDIKITGDIKGLNSKELTNYVIRGVKQWGTSKLESMEYAFYQQPLSSIANDESGALQYVTSFGYTFWGCSYLTSIPEGLFDNCSKVTDFSHAFGNCSSLTFIPKGLFDNCTQVTSFGLTFWGCSSLTSIPEGLFDKCTKVTDFISTFSGCTSLTSIPEKLFDNCTQVTSFYDTFNECSSLISIPPRLFDNCIQVTSFYGTFDKCSSLTSIPPRLFENCTKVTDFSYTFWRCSSITFIPEGLFEKCTKVTDFEVTFGDCSSLTSIPERLFDRCTKVTDFSHAFRDCSSLTSIPEGLFENCTEVTSFFNTFRGCSSLTSIPEKLFDNCTQVTSFEYTFYDCTKLGGESPYTVIDGVKYHLYERYLKTDHFRAPNVSSCFKGCTRLSDYSNIPSICK